MDIKEFAAFAKKNEAWLMQRVLFHARSHGYTRYTSTLEEAWRASISGLTESLIEMTVKRKKVPELSPEEKYDKDPAASFGILEAKRHRTRGVTLPMFLGLMKYYKLSYLELINEPGVPEKEKDLISLYVERFFDRIELAFITEWSGLTNQENLAELMEANRAMTNEKNRYLTVFESLSSPVVLLNTDLTIYNMNHAAVKLFHGDESPGSAYYGSNQEKARLRWLDAELRDMEEERSECLFDKEIMTREGVKVFQVCISRMLDVSDKFNGIVVVLEDITDKTEYNKRLAFFAEHDSLTGLFNRRYLENALKRTVAKAKRGRHGVLVYIDVDHLKCVNDECGHEEGDNLLVNVAEAIKRNVRSEDICARLGGDEFAILYEDISVKEAATAADRIRQSLLKGYELCAEFGVSLSAGVVAVDGKYDYLSIMRFGDVAMYRAKKSGRNRVVISKV